MSGVRFPLWPPLFHTFGNYLAINLYKMKILKPENPQEYIASNPIVITAFYNFCTIPNIELFRDKTKNFCQKNGILGTILLGFEGVNSTIAGTREAIDAFYDYAKQHKFFNGTVFKESYYTKIPFGKLKVKIRKEIEEFYEDENEDEFIYE